MRGAASPGRRARLYVAPGLDTAASAALMLHHKGVGYEQRRLPPGVHALAMVRLGFQSLGEPALVHGPLRVQGTRRIARALDELVTERQLLPADERCRASVERTERWGALFQDATRRLAYCAARRDPGEFAATIRPRTPRLLVPLAVRLAGAAQ
ncbi:MAG TPA: hypothetical protein VF526_10680, partial [Solirubrobacteraceae bacterium]